MSAPAGPLRRVLGNFGLLVGGKAGAGVLSLLVLLIVAPLLGARDFGELVLVHGYVTLVGTVVAFSGWHGIVRYGAEAVEADDGDRLMRLTRFVSLVEVACGVAAVTVAAVLAPVIGPRLGWSPATVAVAVPYSLALVAAVRATPGGLVQIAHRYDWLAAHNTVQPAVRLAGAAAVWWAGGGLVALLWVWFAAALLEGISMWGLGWLALRRLGVRERVVGPVAGVRAANPGLVRFLATTNLDLTLRELAPRLLPLTVGWVLGPAATGVFALAQRASTALQVPATLIGQASYSVMARLLAAGERAAFARTVWHASGWAILAALPLVGLLALFPTRVIALLGGRSFAGGATVLVLIAVAGAVRLGAPALSSGLIALGRPGRSAGINLAASLALFPLLPLLLWRYGVNGAGVHALGTALFATIAMGLSFRRSLTAKPAPAP